MTRHLSAADLTAAILHVRTEYQNQGMSLYDIGNGSCYDFAGDVLNLTFGPGWETSEGRGNWQLLESEQLYMPPEGSDCTIGATAWDWELLQTHWGVSVPSTLRNSHDAIVLQDPSHCWICLDGLHYDCEHPEGVKSFFDLNFFKRWLNRSLPAPGPNGPEAQK